MSIEPRIIIIGVIIGALAAYWMTSKATPAAKG